MLNYAGMLSVGLLLEALVPALTPRFLPFFLITWVISQCGYKSALDRFSFSSSQRLCVWHAHRRATALLPLWIRHPVL